jgi:UPF0716 protein FxsA
LAWLLFAIFIVVPLLEIYAFIHVGSLIGAVPTLALIVLTALVGALLVRWQGLGVISDARRSLARDELPLAAVLHGALLLVSGLLLVTPGFVTDAAGFLLLVPSVRALVATRAWHWLRARAKSRARSSAKTGRRRPDVIDGEAVEIDNDERPRESRGGESSPWASRGRTIR